MSSKAKERLIDNKQQFHTVLYFEQFACLSLFFSDADLCNHRQRSISNRLHLV